MERVTLINGCKVELDRCSLEELDAMWYSEIERKNKIVKSLGAISAARLRRYSPEYMAPAERDDYIQLGIEDLDE